jgi:hypothetical protein
MIRSRCGTGRDDDVAHDRAGLLREAGLVEAAHGAVGEHRCRSNNLADGDHAGATDTGQADRERIGVDDRSSWVGNVGRRRRKRPWFVGGLDQFNRSE